MNQRASTASAAGVCSISPSRATRMMQQAANRPGSRICSSCVSTCTPWPCPGRRQLTQPQLERKLSERFANSVGRAGRPLGWRLPSLPRAGMARRCKAFPQHARNLESLWLSTAQPLDQPRTPVFLDLLSGPRCPLACGFHWAVWKALQRNRYSHQSCF